MSHKTRAIETESVPNILRRFRTSIQLGSCLMPPLCRCRCSTAVKTVNRQASFVPSRFAQSMADSLHKRVQASLDKRKRNGNLRTLEPPPYDASKLVDFSSNDYLSLSKAKVLQQSLTKTLLASQPVASSDRTSTIATAGATTPEKPAASSSSIPLHYGPASSRLLDGNSPAHLLLEKRLAKFFNGKAGLLFNSGFDANSGVFACLASKTDAILYDALIHASAHDGMRHSKSENRIPFKHNSPQDLEAQILALFENNPGYKDGTDQVFVAVESLYSMDGDLAPLLDFLEVIERLFPLGNGHLIVDEAHSTGLYGPDGRGLVCALGIEDRVLIRLHTFGKAMACSGSVVLCSPTLRHYFINYARPLIYSTVMPRILVNTIGCSLDHLEQGRANEARTHLHDLARYCNSNLRTNFSTSSILSFPYMPTRSIYPGTTDVPATSPIVPILTSQPHALSKYLIERGFLVRPIAHPTVPKGKERIRLCLHSCNTKAEIDGLIEVLKEWTTRVVQEPKLQGGLEAQQVATPVLAKL